MRLVVAGTPAVALPCLEALAKNHDIVAVLTRPPAAQGRHARLVPSPVAQWAQTQGIEVLDPVSPRDPALLERLTALAPDCCPVIAYGGLIPPALLAVPAHGWINLHFSLLPRWRGAAPVQHALLAGDETTGVTVFRLVKGLDAGPIYVQREVPIVPDEVAGDLLSRLCVLGAEALCDGLDAISSGAAPVEQSSDGVTLAPKIDAEDARLNPSMTVAEVLAKVRAMSPEPGAWARLSVSLDARFKVLRAREVVTEDLELVSRVGCSCLVATKKALFWGVADGAVELVEVQATGKKVMSGADWARGALNAGAHLE